MSDPVGLVFKWQKPDNGNHYSDKGRIMDVV